MKTHDSDPQLIARLERVHRLVDECIDRRIAGEELSHEQIIESHPDLMPELGEQLRHMAVIEQARLRAMGSSEVSILRDETRDVRRPGPSELPQDYFHGYEILNEIHRGGQGVVYRALQRSTGREVAIKVTRDSAMASARDLARFDREVQILAGLKHPNIVTIHDSGVAASGAAYFVMDFIPGHHLDTYRSEVQRNGSLTTSAMLGLFEQICGAVHTAHLRGIIHRDLKPSNIRVNPQGTPHILDFGLAKPTDDVQSDMTQSGQFVGTLPWSSPEQAEGHGDRVDVRTDVYALGLILYNLLCGKMPYNVLGTFREVLDQITTETAVPPSKHNPAIDHELDTIVLKCLDKSPDRRYQSVADLAKDLDFYQRGYPIEAKRDSTWYVLRKTLRRHMFATTMIISLLVVLSGSTVGLSVLYQNQLEQRNRAQGAEQESRFRFNKIRELANVFIFDFHDRIEHLAGATQARKFVVEKGLEYLTLIADDEQDDPDILFELAEGYVKIAEIQGGLWRANLGDTAGSSLSLNTASDILEDLIGQYPTNHEYRSRYADTLRRIGQGYYKKTELELADQTYDRALAIYDELIDEDHSDWGSLRERSMLINHKADVVRDRGHLEDALELYQQSLAIAERLDRQLGDENPYPRAVSFSYQRMGTIYLKQGLFDEAFEYYDRYIQSNRAIAEKYPERDDYFMDLSNAHISVGDAMWAQNRLADAYEQFMAGHAIRRKLVAADPANVEAQTRLTVSGERVADVLNQMGKTDEALTYIESALSAITRICEQDVMNRDALRQKAVLHEKMGNVLGDTKIWEAAGEHLNQCLADRKLLFEYSPDSAQAMRDIAVTYFKLGALHFFSAPDAEKLQRTELDHYETSKRMYLQALEMIALMKEKDVFPPSDSHVPKMLESRVKQCDEKIASITTD